MSKRILAVLTAALMVVLTVVSVSAKDWEDGTYLITRTTSYADPETGKTVDGGTNIELGDSMCANIVDDPIALVVKGGKYYIVTGVGMAEFTKDTTFYVREDDNSYTEVKATKIGEDTRKDSKCEHYIFEIPSPETRFSIKFYVEPMGRDVQFFVDPVTKDAEEGAGQYEDDLNNYYAAQKAKTRKIIIGVVCGVVVLALLIFLIVKLVKKNKAKKAEAPKEEPKDE